MALADYDTSAEKIAALKCGLMDPALTTFQISSLSVSQTIYLVTHYISLNGKDCTSSCGNMVLPPKISSGNTVEPSSGSGFLYIKDSDINYSDPITKYADRLAIIAETELEVLTNFTVGSNGAMLIHCGFNTGIKINVGGSTYNVIFNEEGVPANIPLKSGDVITTHTGPYADDACAYINLPAGW